MSRISSEKLEQAIRQLPAIHDVRVLFKDVGNSKNGSTSDIEKVHVMAAPGRAPKKLVRDIETLLLLKFDLQVDYRKISLVQGHLDAIRPFLGPRLRLTGVEEHTGDGDRRVEVLLVQGKEKLQGSACGDLKRDPLSLVVEATLDSLNDMLENGLLKLKAVTTVDLDGDEAVLVTLTAQEEATRDRLLGSCFIQTCPLTAAARATLDAVNRRYFSTS